MSIGYFRHVKSAYVPGVTVGFYRITGYVGNGTSHVTLDCAEHGGTVKYAKCDLNQLRKWKRCKCLPSSRQPKAESNKIPDVSP